MVRLTLRLKPTYENITLPRPVESYSSQYFTRVSVSPARRYKYLIVLHRLSGLSTLIRITVVNVNLRRRATNAFPFFSVMCYLQRKRYYVIS